MKFKLSSNIVRQSLAGHSWIGLFAGALIYVVCLTGVPVVFMHELGRWEQPSVELEQSFDTHMLDVGYQQILSENPEYEGAISFYLPTADLPRLMIGERSGSWLVNDDGSLSEKVSHSFIDALIDLHVHLHMPRSIGVVVVGILGVLLCALIISGIFAHPRIFKDAFKLRWGGSAHLQQADLHNRLSVWNIPFQLIIAISGAFFGVYNFALIAVGYGHNDGNFQEILGSIYGQGIQIEQSIVVPEFALALRQLEMVDAQAKPFQITIENANSEQQYILIAAKHPQRLIYAEEYFFEADGSYIEKHGFSDGPIGRQVLFSIHSLHLGDYGGLGIKLLYAVLGLAMAVVSATGFNIWLQRRRTKDWLNNAWVAIVWGTPLAIIAAALLQVIFRLPASPVFWITLITTLGYSQWHDNDVSSAKKLQYTSALLLLGIVLSYYLRFTGSAVNQLSFVINIIFMITASILFFMASRQKRLPQ